MRIGRKRRENAIFLSYCAATLTRAISSCRRAARMPLASPDVFLLAATQSRDARRFDAKVRPLIAKKPPALAVYSTSLSMNASRPLSLTTFSSAGLLAVLGILAWGAGPRAQAEEKVSFNRDVRPILSDKCYFCHGFDPKQRKADRRLDTPEGAMAELDGVRAIVPGDLQKSEAW